MDASFYDGAMHTDTYNYIYHTQERKSLFFLHFAQKKSRRGHPTNSGIA